MIETKCIKDERTGKVYFMRKWKLGELGKIDRQLERLSDKYDKIEEKALIKRARILKTAMKLTKRKELILKITKTKKGGKKNSRNTSYLHFSSHLIFLRPYKYDNLHSVYACYKHR